MKMNLISAPIAGTIQPWARVARRAVALGVMAVGLSSAHAIISNAVSTLTGTVGTPGFSNSAPVTFRFSSPSGVAVDSSGNLFVTDTANNVIRKMAISGSTVTVTTFAGSASGTAGNGDGTGTAAFFNAPHGIAIDGANNLYVADTSNHAIRKITSAGVVTTLAGTAGGANGSVTVANGFVNNGANSTGVLFNSPLGIAADHTSPATYVYVADTQNNAIRQLTVSSGATSTLAGPVAPATTSGSTDASGTSASFNHPDGIALDNGGTTLYIADTSSHTIRKLVIVGAGVTTFAGTAGTPGYNDATGTSALFTLPQGVAVDGSGNVLVADTFNHAIRTINSSQVVSLYAGSTTQSSSSTDGLATAARFNLPSGIAFYTSGGNNFVYVVDTNNQTIRLISLAASPSISVQPSNVSIAAGQSLTAHFSVTASGNPPVTYQWQKQTGGTGSFNNLSNDSTYSGVFTASLAVANVTTGMNNDTFKVVVTNAVSSTTSSAVTLTALQVPAFTSADNTSFNIGQAGTFSVTTTASPALSQPLTYTGSFPTWASFNASGSGATITGTPPDALLSPFSFTISATNSAGTRTQPFTLAVSTGPTISSQPSNQTVGSGASAQFSVTATSSSAMTYQWYRQPSGGSGFSALTDNGIYSGSGSSLTSGSTATLTVNNTTLAMSGDQFHVILTNSVGTTQSSAVSLSITQAPSFTNLASATFVENASNTFTLQATGSPAATFTLTGGALPTGVTLTAGTSGVVSGTPAVGTSATSPYSLQFTATNGVNPVATQNFTLTISPTALVPAFTTQPTNLTVALGQTATLTVAATGTPTPTYQWQRQLSGGSGFSNIGNDSTFSGTTTVTLTITNPSSGMSGDQYRCVATNTSGSTASSAATLTVVVGTTITTFAGHAGSSGSTDATGTSARFNSPSSIAIDSSGNLYVADTSNHVVRKITSAGVVTTLAGTAGSAGSTDGTGSAASFNGPSGIAVDSVGNVYVADTYNHTIRAITPAGVVTTLAGLAGNSGSADGSGSTARFNYPSGVAVDSSSTVYVADTSNHTIRKIVGGTVSTFAGSAGVRGNTNSPALFAYPNALIVDSSGNVFVADSYNYTIRKITSGGSVSTYAGTAGSAGSTDGTGTAALFNQPSGITVDSSGNLYVADTYNDTIRKIASGAVVTTLAGSPGVIGTVDGTGALARFSQPYGITVDSSGNLYIADTRNHTIRRSGTVSAPSIQTQPQSQFGGIGQTASFSVTATGAPTPAYFQWQRQPAGTSGFLNLSNDSTYSGVATATLMVTGITAIMHGDEFKVVVSNLISPDATSSAATLSTVTPAVFTSAASASFNIGLSNTFSVTTTSTPAVTYSATGLPSWLTLGASSGVLSGTPPDATGSPLSLTITANNGATATQSFTLTLVVAVLAPIITTQPAGVTVSRGATASLSVTASGTAPLSYQWSTNGIPITGATGSTLTISSAQPANAGDYAVTVTNSLGSVTSNAATIAVNAAPVITSQPRSQTVILGSSVTFSVGATASPSPTYQWRGNGIAIAGANSPTLTVNGAQAGNAGNYDVVVANTLGQVVSSVAQLVVSASASAPQITSQPAARTVVVGTSTTFTVAASAAPAPSYQWRKNGTAISGATAASFIVAYPQTGDAGSYDVVVTNSAGSVTSSAAALTVLSRSYAGVYFGSFGTNLGNFAIFVRPDNTGVFLGYLPGSNVPVKNLNLTVGDTGQFSFTQSGSGGISAFSTDINGAPRAAAAGDIGFVGSIAQDGSLSGTVTGVSGAALSATKSADVGATQAVAGYYGAAASNTSSTLLSITSATGQAFALTQTSTGSNGGTGIVDATGHVTVITSNQSIELTINADTSTLSGTTVAGSTTTTYTGASEAVLAAQRLGNISSRANVGTGANVAIAGFVISGTDSKPVLIRAIGPTLSLFPGITNPLGAPKLDLYRSNNDGSNTIIGTNTGWSTAPNTAAIVAASAQSGAFALNATSADSVIFTTLAPGNYTGVVSSANGGTGIALVEVYDLSAAAAGQKLFNISTRAIAGTGTSTLTAGIVINGSVPKRVLVRAVGPGLVQFGFSNALPQTQLQVYNSSNQVVAQNTGWGTSPDASAIASLSAQVGAFPIVAGSGDSAMIISLAPGNYTALVNPVGSTTSGVAIIEVYELP